MEVTLKRPLKRAKLDIMHFFYRILCMLLYDILQLIRCYFTEEKKTNHVNKKGFLFFNISQLLRILFVIFRVRRQKNMLVTFWVFFHYSSVKNHWNCDLKSWLRIISVDSLNEKVWQTSDVVPKLPTFA